MCRTLILALLAGASVLLPTLAEADIRPSPARREPALAAAIKNAGYPCPGVTSSDEVTGSEAEEFTKERLSPYKVTCSNGRRYMVGLAGGGTPARPPSQPTIVRPLE